MTMDYRKNYYKGPAKFYFFKILNTLIEFGNLRKEEGIILDYGCGVSHLKRTLNKDTVVGYDIIPELSDIDDFKKLKPVKIVLSGVFEHMYLSEIEELLRTFISMNPDSALLVYLPTENIISKIGMFLCGVKSAHDDHVSKYKAINQLIEKYYFPEKRKYIYFRMAQITKYVRLQPNNE